MFIFLPIIALLTIFIIVNRLQKQNDWRESLPPTFLIWGIILTGITELLSILKLINFAFLASAWLVVDIILIIIYFRFQNNQTIHHPQQNNSNVPKKINPTNLLLLSGISLIIATVGMIAIIAPPNNWDSMDYHMSRVVHWIQNYSVTHYPTSYTPQLYQNPWSEFVILHLQILSQGDYFANLVQWFSMTGCVIIVSLIAKQLGAELRGQIFSAVVVVTIPMGILQASSTQNDYVLAFWLVCLAYYTLSVAQTGKIIKWNNYFYVGSSIGLAILTKGTAYFYVFPFIIWLCIAYIKRLRLQVWQPVLIISCISLSINFGHYLRNYYLFASFLGEPSIYKNQILGLNILVSNILRNLALHLGTPIGFFNGKLNKLIQVIHNICLGVDVADPRITFTKSFFVPGGLSTIGITGNENSAGNLLHILLFILTVTVFINNKQLRKQKYILAYLITVSGTFIVFCYLVKWQAWNSRLHLAFFVLISPFIGWFLDKIKKEKIAIALVTILLCSSLTWVFFNRYRIVIGNNSIFQISRNEQYFTNRPYLKSSYIEAVTFLKSQKCFHVGLVMGNDPWEYPFWVLGQQNNKATVKYQHINVTNISSKIAGEYPYKNFEPCGIIAMQTQKSKQAQQTTIIYQNLTYTKLWNYPDVGVFLKN